MNSEDSSPPPATRTRSRSQGGHFEVTARGPLKRTRRGAENKPPAAVNGDKDMAEDSDENSPKKRKVGELVGGSSDKKDMKLRTLPNKKKNKVGSVANDSGDEMDVQSADEDDEQHKDDDMDAEEDSHPFPSPGKAAEAQQKAAEASSQLFPSQQTRSFGNPLVGDLNLCKTVTVNLGRRHQNDQKAEETRRVAAVEPSRRSGSDSYKHLPPNSTPTITQHRLGHEVRTSITDRRQNMEHKVRSPGLHRSNLSHKTQHLENHISSSKLATDTRKQEKGKATGKKHPGSRSSSRGWCMWLCQVVFALLVSVAVGFLASQNGLLHASEKGLPTTPPNPAEFETRLSMLESRFPSQRPDLWTRSRIHLNRHLQTSEPEEPVSLILTSGRGAETTLRCLARHLASAFSSALNASVLHIDGASKAGQDANQVKLDLDRQLSGAFEGDKPVAVIHRFEELPPSSTIIFYRYCDHENAAYKNVFLAFTVLLPQETVGEELSLKEVEELVQDHIADKFIGPDGAVSFNTMDTDKLSGLWSRISHLILPVAAEEQVEQAGCMD